MQKHSQVYFVSGVCGAGKSSVLKYLKKMLPSGEYNIHDFDERGVPNSAGKKWHSDETLHWLNTARENSKHKKSTIICGFADPKKFWKLHKKKNHISAKLFLLHASADTIRKRLTGRYLTPESIKEINRASGVSLEKFIENNASYAPTLFNTFKNENSPIINTDTKTPIEVAQEIVKIIKAE